MRNMKKLLMKEGLSRLAKRLLGFSPSDGAPRADMYLPDWIFALGLVVLLAGIAAGIYAAISLLPAAAIGAVAGIGLGIGALLCWKNQTIRMLSDDAFEYRTFLGNTRTYRFSEITELKQNSDSYTLIVAHERVHIESCAILSDRLTARINQSLAER